MSKLKLSFVAVFVFAAIFSNAQALKPGDKAPDFSLKNVDGKMVSLADFKDAKGFIIVFTCNSCPYSIAYEDRIIALDAKYKSKGFPVVAINPNDPALQSKDSYEAMVVRAGEKKFTFPYLFDNGQKVYPQYGATRTPNIFIVQKVKDELIVQYVGAIDNNYKDAADATEKYVEDAVESLLKKKDVKVPVTVAVGCGIKVQK
jgi:peroxiredoxin